jgi:hypothetical protein
MEPVIARKRFLLVTWSIYLTVAAGYICFLVCLHLDGCESKEYPSGKDTIASLGDGRFEVARMTHKDKGGYKRVRSLEDNEKFRALLWDISEWYRFDPWVVAIGADREYVVLNYRTGVHNSYSALAKAPDEHSQLWYQARNLQRGLELVGGVLVVAALVLIVLTLSQSGRPGST